MGYVSLQEGIFDHNLSTQMVGAAVLQQLASSAMDDTERGQWCQESLGEEKEITSTWGQLKEIGGA